MQGQQAMGVSQMESTAKKGELQQLKEVVHKVFEYTPPVKDGGRKHAYRERDVKHRRSGMVAKKAGEAKK